MRLLVGLFCAFAGSMAQAGVADLKSSQGNRIQIASYLSENAVASNSAETASINVMVGIPKSQAYARQIRVLVMSACPGAELVTNTIDLQGAAGYSRTSNLNSFVQVKAIDVPHMNGQCTQQLSVVIDGQWQQDPINHTNNFNFTISR